MADEGDQMHMEHQSNAGKWILTVLAILVVIVSVILLGWEMLYTFHVLPIRLTPR